MPPPAEELMTRVANGDEQAFAALYNHGAGPVFGMISRILADRPHAEEVTQEVWLQVWQTAARYDASKASVMSWIMTLAHRRAVDRVRSVQSSRNRERSALFESVLNRPFDEVTESAEAAEECRRVRRSLFALTELQRQALLMAYYQGHTYQEIGQALHVALPTIKSRIRDGLMRLRDCLEVTPER